jgi:hypothetical protein
VTFDELWPTRRLISSIAIPLSDSRETNVWRSYAWLPWPAAYRLADHLATGMAPTAIAMKINIVADLVGDTGIEPVTSSV